MTFSHCQLSLNQSMCCFSFKWILKLFLSFSLSVIIKLSVTVSYMLQASLAEWLILALGATSLAVILM